MKLLQKFPCRDCVWVWGYWSLKKAFLSLLAILWNSAFRWLYLSFSPLLFASLLFTAICKASPDSHFAFLHFFSMWMSWSLSPVQCHEPHSIVHQCREPARGTPLVTKVMRKEARQTQRWDWASGVPLDILKHLPPENQSLPTLLLCALTSDFTGGCPPPPSHSLWQRVNLQLQLIKFLGIRSV